MATSVPIEEELVPFLGAAISGLAAWDADNSTGELFQFRRPDQSIDAISFRTEAWLGRQGYPGLHECTLVVESQGANAFANHMKVVRYLRNRQGERGIFEPLSLTSYRIENFVDQVSMPQADSILEDHSIVFRSTHRLTVKETNP